MLAAKHFDIVTGVDIHIILIPTPGGPVPTPLPHPFVGIMFDPDDYDIAGMAIQAATSLGLGPAIELKQAVDAAIGEAKSLLPSEQAQALIEQARSAGKEALGISPPKPGPASVQVNGLPRVKCGSKGEALPPHIPMGGPFQKGKVDNVCEMFLGSMTVHADNSPMSFTGCMVFSCSCIGMPSPVNSGSELYLPTSVINCIPLGMPVMVGGAPVPDFNAMANKLFDKAFNSALNALKNSKLWKNTCARIHNAAAAAMDKMGIPADSFVRDMVHDELCDTVGHPVVVATGKVFTDRRDFGLPGAIPLTFDRKWKSTSVYEGPLGHGWHWKYDLALTYDGDAVVMRMADGRPVIFPRMPDDEAFTNPSEGMTLLSEAGAFVVRNDKENRFYRFVTPAGGTAEPIPLTAVEDGAGRSILFKYNQQGHLQEIQDSGGRSLPVRCDKQGRILSISAPHPKQEGRQIDLVKFAYSPQGDLVQSIDPLGNAFSYTYQNHLLTRETNRNGLSFYFTYDERAYCTRTWGDGGIHDVQLVYNLEEKWTEVENSLGHRSKYYWTDGGLNWKIVDALGYETIRRYDRRNKLLAETDELGRYTAYEYDEAGNKTKTIYPDGTSISLKYKEGLLVSAIDQLNGGWSWSYNEKRQLIQRTDCMGTSTHYRYGDNGNLAEIINPSGNSTVLTFNDQQSLTNIVSADGTTSRWQYDKLGRLIESIDPRGNSRKRTLDLLGNILRLKEPDGNTRELNYDAEENIVRAKDEQHDVRFEYKGMNQLGARIEASTRVEFKYNTEEDLVGIINEHGYAYRFELDARGQVVTESGFDGLTRQYKRDPAGQVAAVLRPGERRTDYSYDKLGRVTKVKHWDGSAERYAYRADGEILQAKNGAIQVEFERDALGRVLVERQGSFEVQSAYDILGNRISIQSSLGADVQIARNHMGDVASVESATANADDPWSVQFERDLLGLEMERALPGGVRSRWQRDHLGRPIKQQTFAGGNRTRSRTYKWGVNNRLSEIIDDQQGRFIFEHDSFGNLSAATYPDGTRELRLPDAVGNLFKTSQQKDRKYGPAGQLLEADGTVFEYDPEGNITAKIRPDGKRWRYEWNAAGMLVRVIRPDGKIVYFTYDALGRRIAKRYVNELTRWVWDGNLMLHEWQEEAPPTSLHARRTENTEPTSASGQIIIRRRDEKIRTQPSTAPPTTIVSPEPALSSLQSRRVPHPQITTWLFEPGTFAPIAKLTPDQDYSIVTDHLGTPVSMFDEKGEKVWALDLTVYGDVRNLDGWRGECPFRYPGQYEDVETGLYYNRFRYYDPEAGGYVSQDPIRLSGGDNIYGYSIDCNIFTDPFGLVGLDDKGYSVYGLYEDGASEPYYVGITNNTVVREGQHKNSGRLRDGDEMKLLDTDTNMKYKEAKGKEQALIETLGTKTGTIGQDLSEDNLPACERGNKVASFVKTRKDKRGKAYKAQYDKAMGN